MYDDGKVMVDMGEIGMNAAVMPKTFLEFIYTNVGSVSQTINRKVIRDSISKSNDQISSRAAAPRYHGYAVVSDTQHLLITNQSASLGKDESSRKKKGQGEKPDPKMYLNIMLLAVVPTKNDADCPHGFSNVDNVVQMWCGCKAGMAECIHCGMAVLDQIREWAPNYTSDDICTEKEKQWQHRGACKLHSYNAMHPIHCHGFEKIVDMRTNFKYNKVRDECKANDSLHFHVLAEKETWNW
jgi:hypothetical protein